MNKPHQFSDELDKARRRIGKGSEGYFEWVLRVAETNLTNLSIGDLENLRYEIGAFISLPAIIASPKIERVIFGGFSGKRIKDMIRSRLATLCREQSITDEEALLPSHAAVTAIHTAVRRHLLEFMKMGRTSFTPTGQVTRQLALGGGENKDNPPEYVQTFAMGEVLDVFMSRVLDLMTLHGHRLRRCIECTILFLANRVGQQYCGAACQNRAGTKRFRAGQTQKKVVPKRFRVGRTQKKVVPKRKLALKTAWPMRKRTVRPKQTTSNRP